MSNNGSYTITGTPSTGLLYTTSCVCGCAITHDDGYGNITVTGCTCGNLQISTASSNITIQTMTSEEETELQSLEDELKRWTRQQELLHFQNLSPELRQDVVDEAMIRDVIAGIDSVGESDFDHIDRLNELRNMKNMYTGITLTGTPHWTQPQVYKYHVLLDKFTTQELADAHVAATLEEQLDE